MPTITKSSDVCEVVTSESLTYSCNDNGNNVRWTSSKLDGEITATPSGNPGIPDLTVSGVTLMESDNGDGTCLVSNLTFSGTLSALDGLNGATLSCDNINMEPADSVTIVVPGMYMQGMSK